MKKFKELIKKIYFACSTDEARPLFTGILVELQDGKITFVGTNTHRLINQNYGTGKQRSYVNDYSFQSFK